MFDLEPLEQIQEKMASEPGKKPVKRCILYYWTWRELWGHPGNHGDLTMKKYDLDEDLNKPVTMMS